MGRENLAAFPRKKGTVIIGDGLDQERFTGGEQQFPTRHDLDKITTEHPLIISRVCGHILFANTQALRMAGIESSMLAMEGIEVPIDAGSSDGILTGDNAAIIRALIPWKSDGEIYGDILYSLNNALRLGITSAASFDTDGPDFENIIKIYKRIYANSDAPHIRVTLQCGIHQSEKLLDYYIDNGYLSGTFIIPHWLKMGPLKLFADGSLGSRTALLRTPYTDSPDTRGVEEAGKEFLARMFKKGARSGMQVIAHAIGDEGIERVIVAMEETLNSNDKIPNPLRHGVVHCQITDRGLLERMAKNKIHAIVQPIFLSNDLYMLEKRVGYERAKTSYAWGTMEKLGIPVSYGTDNPVSAFNPLLCIQCAVTRENIDTGFPSGGINPREKVDVYTAVDAYTRGSAFANFDENRVGRIAPGMLADLVLLDKDIFTIPSNTIKTASVETTFVGGKIAYQK